MENVKDIEEFCRQDEKINATFQRLAKSIGELNSEECLQILSRILVEEPDLSPRVASHFRPVLLDLLHRVSPLRINQEDDHVKFKKILSSLFSLATTFPGTTPFVDDYLQDKAQKWLVKSATHRNKDKDKYEKSSSQVDVNFIKSCYNFIRLSSNLSQKRVWTFVLSYLISEDATLKWFSCLCSAILYRFSPFQFARLLQAHFKQEQIHDFGVLFDVSYTKNLIWLKMQNEKNYAKNWLPSICQNSDKVVSVSGVLLSKFPSKEDVVADTLVEVASTKWNLRSLAIAVKRHLPVLIQGPIGCGKTALVEYLAAVTGRKDHLLKIQLGEHTDSKMLLGNYQCADGPTKFVWRPGALVKAVELGYWVLLEDIDNAPSDVVSLLIPLLETNSLPVPGRVSNVKAHPNFQLFATRRLLGSCTNRFKEHPGKAELIDQLFTKIAVEPVSSEELKVVVTTKWPSLELLADKIIEMYLLLIGETPTELPNTGRTFSIRDLLKWCKRVARNIEDNPESSAMNSFQDALDCFCFCFPSTKERRVVGENIASKMNITQYMANHYCDSYKPDISFTSETISVGRVDMKRLDADVVLTSRRKRSPFAFTRESSVLLEQVAQGIIHCEPVLLVGETGTGKTATVQYLAEELGQKLVVINMNQQSDAADFLGGFKPVDLKLSVNALIDEYMTVFGESFSKKKNETFFGHISTLYRHRQWDKLFFLMLHSKNEALNRFSDKKYKPDNADSLKEKWSLIGDRIHRLQMSLKNTQMLMGFTFVEGSLVKALKEGYWVLLDEINLASAETLECLSGVLESSQGSILLLEKGELKPIKRNPNFRLLACMNAATDVGKKDLPPGLRNRFTEFYMDEPSVGELRLLTENYLTDSWTESIRQLHFEGITNLYKEIKRMKENNLLSGTGLKPHFSLRNLCRALAFAAGNPCKHLTRSLYEGFCFSYLTQLDRSSHDKVENCIYKNIFVSKNKKRRLDQDEVVDNKKLNAMKRLPEPVAGKYEEFEGYWVAKGDEECQRSDLYILTDSVKRNLKDLARVVSAGRCPVLLQGSTSVGKTSLIKWLAEASGNRCFRVNNHEHTDLQEYVGAYATDENGQLVFKEGVLVDAMRRGYWIVLDELNLAPSDVLEALNRVLDDNRELFIAETQETVKAHPRFLLFATQNPPGLYGGRKMLSRAFRNRFIELHFEEIPALELQMILHKRCSLPPSYCKKMVAVMTDLQNHRSSSGIFAGKHGLITIRDLFRWAERYRLANRQDTKFYNWDQHLADEGYILLAGRVRKEDEDEMIVKIIEKHFKCKVDPANLFAATLETASPTVKNIIERVIQATLPTTFQHLVWTYQMRRLAVLVGQALEFGEPVLLVGETGCGKTTICQLLAALMDKPLHTVNCHMHSEAADFLGGLRPVRRGDTGSDEDSNQQRLFEWVDGHLVTAMKEGNVFLADEISLADDSVLERLNSVLEPERTLLLAEKGFGKDGDIILVAEESFRFLATMNPGGDYGKKELSPALRNRFTEIWCPSGHSRQDLLRIIEHNLYEGVQFQNQEDGTSGVGHAILDFVDWFQKNHLRMSVGISIRDILSWVNFINVCVDPSKTSATLETTEAYVHGAFLVFIDGVGAGSISYSNVARLNSIRESAIIYLQRQVEDSTGQILDKSTFCYQKSLSCIQQIIDKDQLFGLGPFFIEKGTIASEDLNGVFSMTSPTTNSNVMRVMRAMQLTKPILLEGSPGLGKTSLLIALAKASGHRAVRINLSEQTDICDLFGADLPVEDGVGGQFAWRDGPLLSALKNGHWVILDELNLASQSVLEGLNACLDHRAEIYIPELGMTFRTPVQFKRRIFACQNPLHEGSARKGLPRSFQNRFTQVFLEPLLKEDLEFITKAMYPQMPSSLIEQMVAFHDVIYSEVILQGKWGTRVGPWDINLRDLLRWCQILTENKAFARPFEYVKLIYADRMRTASDKRKVIEICWQIFGDKSVEEIEHIQWSITSEWVLIGHSFLPRSNEQTAWPIEARKLHILPSQLPALRSLAKCLQMNWMAILVGPHASGKTSLVSLLAKLTNQQLDVLSMNSDMDTTELLGGFEQADLNRRVSEITAEVVAVVDSNMRDLLLDTTNVNLNGVKQLMNLKQSLQTEIHFDLEDDELAVFTKRIEDITNIIHQLRMPEDKSRRLLEGLQQLLILARRDGSINCGGRFEWVDSRLVTSLQKGNWLLIDNVNLCSPSILDRLNGLLEPGGELVVSERGQFEGGEIPTYKPHPNFRLILSVDPKNGEISRAMRNRGVEIYVEDRRRESPIHQLELKTMLDSEGFVGCDGQRMLCDIHNRLITGHSIGCDKYFVSDLIRAAQLTVQRVQEGDEVIEALRDSCVDVYVRQQLSTQAKQAALNVVEDASNDRSTSRQIFYPSSLISADEFDFVPELARAKSDSSALVHLLFHHLFGLDWSECRYLGLDCIENIGDGNLENSIRSAWKIYFLKSSLSDSRLRFNYVTNLLESTIKSVGLAVTEFKPISRLAQKILDSFEHYFGESANFVDRKMTEIIKGKSGSEVAFDLRWNQDLFDHANNHLEQNNHVETLCLFANRMIVCLEFDIFKSAVQMEKEEFFIRLANRNKSQPLSVLELSWAYSKGVKSDCHCPEIFMANLGNFLMALIAAIEAVLTVYQQLTDDSVAEWFIALSRVRRFWTICCRSGSGSHFTPDYETEMHCHWTWMVEKAFPVMFHKTWQNDRRSSFVDLRVAYDNLVQHFQLKESSWVAKNLVTRPNGWRVIEKLLSVVDSPQPFENHLEVEFYKKISMLQTNKTAQNLSSTKNQVFRANIFNAILSSESGELRLKTLNELEYDENGARDVSEDRTELEWPLQLRPLFDHLFLLHQHRLLKDIYRIRSSGSCLAETVIEQLTLALHLAKLTSNATSTNMAILHKLRLAIEKGNVDPSLLSELLMEHFELVSAAKEMDSETLENPFKHGISLLHMPHHSITAADILNPIMRPGDSMRLSSTNLAIFSPNVAVKDCDSVMSLLRGLCSLSWSNAHRLASVDYDTWKSDICLIEDMVSMMNKSLGEILGSCSSCVNDVNKDMHHLLCNQCSVLRDIDVKLTADIISNLQRAKDVQCQRDEAKISVASSWAGGGCIQAFLLAPIMQSDPVVKRRLQMEFWQDVRSELLTDLNVAELQCVLTNGKDDDLKHHQLLVRRKGQLNDAKQKIDKLSTDRIFRPVPSQYEALRVDLTRLTISPQRLDEPLDKTVFSIVCDCRDRLLDPLFASQIKLELRSWKRFVRRIVERYQAYRDLTGPSLLGVLQMSYGMALYAWLCDAHVQRQKIGEVCAGNLERMTSSILQFPSVGCNQILSCLDLAAYYQSDDAQGVLGIVFGHDSGVYQHHRSQLTKSSLMELKNQIVTVSALRRKEFRLLEAILQRFVSVWHEQQEKREEEEKEKESLYHYKGKEYGEIIDDEKQLNASIKRMFPTYAEEFADLIVVYKLDKNDDEDKTDVNSQNDAFGEISKADIEELTEVHHDIITNYAQCWWHKSRLSKEESCNFVAPLLQRYQIGADILKCYGNLLDNRIDPALFGGHLVAATAIHDALYSNQSSSLGSQIYNFYYDSNISETVGCRSLLINFGKRISQLLVEWPDHPALLQVLKIIDRILSFSVTSPVMKFVTGFELLLGQAQEWEKNAHKGISLMDHLELISNQILSWRKQELSSWPICLDEVERKCQRGASKWWLYVYGLVCSEKGKSDDKHSMEDITKSLKQLMETSPIGEYDGRLAILSAFSCHLAQYASSPRKQKMIAAFWNVVQYYSQFQEAVQAKIKDLRKPIEKDLKNFVKISRWNDINFWAVKESAHKAHMTLHKQIKHYEIALKEVASSIFTLKDPIFNKELSKPKLPNSVDDLQLSKTCKKYLNEKVKLSEEENSLLKEATVLPKPLSHYCQRSQKLCLRFSTKSRYLELSSRLDDFTGECISGMKQLQSLEVDRKASKEKQKSEAKSIHSRKRKALADLYKHLSNLGLSYRKGLSIYQNDPNFSEAMCIFPVSVNDSVQQFNEKTPIDDYLIETWEDSSRYYYRAIFQMAALQSAMNSPSKELGPANLQRNLGFSSHLMDIAVGQRKHISNSVDQLCRLRFLLKDCTLRPEDNRTIFPPQNEIKFWSEALVNLLSTTRQAIGQFLTLMQTKPSAPDGHEEVYRVLSDEVDWSTVASSAECCLSKLNETWKEVKKLILLHPSQNDRIYNWETFDSVHDAYNKLSCCVNELQLPHLDFDTTAVFIESLKFVKEEVSRQFVQFQNWTSSQLSVEDKFSESNSSVLMTKLQNASTNLTTRLLGLIQEVYKLEVANFKKDSGEEFSMLDDLVSPLDRLFCQFNLKDVYRSCRRLLKYWRNVSSLNLEPQQLQHCHSLFYQPFPLLRQYISSCEVYLMALIKSHRATVKLTSILVGIFTELVLKGFCLPPELGDECDNKEAGTEFKDVEGGGIGEGEGMKDVSERLENEDQLDEAHKEGSMEEKEQKDKDKKELEDEEHGIEMSDDFDGKVHDVDAEDDEDKSDDEDESEDEELEKQMGDLQGDEADKLDEKIWGSDDDEDESEDEQSNDEEQEDEHGPGASVQDETRMVAKDDNKNEIPGDESDPEKDDSKEPDIEKELMNMKDDREYDDRPDPYQDAKEAGDEKQDEDMELPEDMELDDAEKPDEDNDGEGEEEADEVEKMDEEAGQDDSKEEEQAPKNEDQAVDDINMEEPEEEKLDDGHETSEQTKEVEEENQKDGSDKEEEGEDKEKEKLSSLSTPSEKTAEPSDQKVDSSNVVEGGKKHPHQPQEANETSANKDMNEVDEDVDTGGGGEAQEQSADNSHLGQRASSQISAQQPRDPQLQLRERPGPSNEKRSLGSTDKPFHKRLRTEDSLLSEENEGRSKNEEKSEMSDLYSHVQNAMESDTQVLDAATKEQMEHHATNEEIDDNDDDVKKDIKPMEDKIELETELLGAKASMNMSKSTQENLEMKGADSNDIEMDDQAKSASDGDKIMTLGVERGSESFTGTNVELWHDYETVATDTKRIREEVAALIQSWSECSLQEVETVYRISYQEAEFAWSKFEDVTSHLAQELCEQLRLTLEPSVAAKFKGDYRTGKRLNMRKVIPYIASQFRKDKIWLRRSKPSKRDYKIMIAMDDSSSMADNQSKQLAFESLALITKALSLLEAGQIAVASFGERAAIVHPFNQQFNTSTGAELLRNLSFEQKKTKVGQLLDLAVKTFAETRGGSSSVAQLLVLISDGRGLFDEGSDAVTKAVRRAKETGILTVFLALDNPANKDSIFDIRMPIFKGPGQMPEIKSYMDDFPFPFYVVLRDIQSLPTTLGDALRQWFELVNNAEG